MLRRALALSIAGILALPLAAAAKAPHVNGTFSMPHGLSPGGFVIHGMTAGPGNTMWLTTETASGATTKAALLRIAPSGHVSKIKISAPGGISFTGLGLGPDHKIWFSGTGNAGQRRGVSGSVSGTKAHSVMAKDSRSWEQLAVAKGTAYLTTGFGDLMTSKNGTTFGNLVLDNINPSDILPFGGGLAVAGDGGVGVLAPGGTSATLFTGPGGSALASRYEAVAKNKLWFLSQIAGGVIDGFGVVGAGGTATIHHTAGLRNITTGPDGAVWVLTNSKAERLSASGKVNAKVRLPGGQRGILIGGATKKYVWVATLTGSGAGKLVRIAVYRGSLAR